MNLYGFCGNDGVNGVDYLGNSWVSSLFRGVGDALKSAGRWVATNWATVVSVALNFVPGVGPLLSMAFSTAYGAYTGGIQGALMGLAGSMIGGGIGRGIAGGVISQFGLKGLTAALTQGVITGAFAGAGAAVATGGNIWEGMLIGGVAGGVVNGGLYGIEHGALGPGAQGTYQRGSDWLRGISTRIRNWAFGPQRQPNITYGNLRIVNDDGTITEVTGSGDSSSPRMVDYGDGVRAPINSPIYGNNVRMTPGTARIAGRLQSVVESVNNRLADNPELARTVLSDAEMRAASNPRVAPMAWGNAVERLFWEEVQASPELSGMIERLGGPNRVDFMGIGAAEGLQFDVTTVKGIPSHLARPYGPNSVILPYVRPF